jgi:putative FmdB family regulatory protein
MPMYDFRCPDCGHEFEELVFGNRLPGKCPSCEGAAIERKVSACAARISGGGGGASVAPSSGCGGGSGFR